MKKALLISVLAAGLVISANAHAEFPQVQRYVEGAIKKGEARLKYLLWDVYDATLYTSNDQYKETEPFALKLDYLISLNGKDISERSIEEIQKQGFKDQEKLTEWKNLLDSIFPDVDEGVSITGIRDSKGHTIFYKDDQKIGQIDDPEFTRYFFDIWLGDKTSEPELRQQLLGLN